MRFVSRGTCGRCAPTMPERPSIRTIPSVRINRIVFIRHSPKDSRGWRQVFRGATPERAKSRERGSAEDFVDAFDALHQGIDVFTGGIDIDARPRRRRDVHPAHEGLRTVVAGADADAV